MPKDITIGLTARNQILQGALKTARTITTTYGPLGRTALLDRMVGLLATKDGVTVAQEIHLKNKLENMGCQILKEACLKVNEQVGDGTTTVALLAAALLLEGHKQIVAGVSPIQLARELQAAGQETLKTIREISSPVENQKQLEGIAKISCNGDDEIAKLMSEACMAVGQDGMIVIEDGQHVESKLEFKDGAELECGPVGTGFLRDQTERIMEGTLVAVVKSTLRTYDDIKDILEVASQWPQNPLMVFAGDIDGDAFRTMLLNNNKSIIECCAFNAPAFNNQEEFLKDVAAMAGAHLVDPMVDDVRSWDSEWFGSFRQANIKKDQTVITTYPDKFEFAQARIKELKHQETDSDFDQDKILKRIAKLSGGMAILKIGGVTEIALKERRARVEDVLGSTRAALKSGVVPGGGRAYQLAALKTDHPVLKKALLQPLNVHAQRLGLSATLIAESLPNEPWVGWDALQNQVRDLRTDPIIADPTLVVENVISAAISVASALLTVEAGITIA